jgi:hypothetical protein
VIRRHPNKQMSLMRARRSLIALCVLLPADVRIKSTSDRSPTNTWAHRLNKGILETRRSTLALYKVPALVSFVPSLAVAVFGNLVRS